MKRVKCEMEYDCDRCHMRAESHNDKAPEGWAAIKGFDVCPECTAGTVELFERHAKEYKEWFLQ